MPGKLDGKVVLVTGGASGIGRTACLIAAREGAKVLVSDISVQGGEETVELVGRDGGAARFIRADVADKGSVEDLVGEAVQMFGRLDGAFNNAGIEGAFANTVDQTDEDFDRMIAINLKGVWLCMRAELRQMRQQGGGSIVNTASIAGLIGMPPTPIYSAAKHGVIGLTKTAALEFAKDKIRVNAVCPGVIETPMVGRLFERRPRAQKLVEQQVGRCGRPEEIGEAAAWLMSDAASFVTGVALPIDGGWTAK